MADPSPSLPPEQSSETCTSTTITDLNLDPLVHCASFLNLQDLSHLAMSCKHLQRVAYSDSVWLRLFREQWPQPILSSFLQTARPRELYRARYTDLLQLKFTDPLVADVYTDPISYGLILLDKYEIIFSQGSSVNMVKIDNLLNGRDPLVTRNDHRARVTCMRLFSLNETSVFRTETQQNDKVLITSSCDHTIRLWWKGCSQRCFRGHNGPVLTLSDKLLGDNSGKVFASGGVDGTVRVWSLISSGKRGQHALRATLYGHEKSVVSMSVAGHKTSLLVSASRDSKVRVWDITASSAVRSSCCVGMTSVPGSPVGMKCHESLLYVATGSSVVAIDLRTMKKAFDAGIHPSDLCSFEILPSKSLVCTGGSGRARLWDMRKADVMAELDGHEGLVTLLHMDPYKVITGGPENAYVNVWETDTATQTNSLMCCCCSPNGLHCGSGCSAMAADGCRIVTATCDEELNLGVLRFRDFKNATRRVSLEPQESEPASKFWGPQSYDDDTDDSDG